MPSPNSHHGENSLYLPQYGFGPALDFIDLVKHNRFLFRVYTPKERSPFFDNTEPFFIAPKFDERYRNPSPGGLRDWDVLGPNAVASATYEDVARHMNWTTRSLSPYISTSFSAIWSIWEAVRRYHHGVKQDVEIAIIDAHAVSDRAVTAAYLLGKASPQERHKAHWKWFRFSQESQAVLVYGAIPGTAVLASVPLTEILRKLPSYFLKDCSDINNVLSCLAWNYTEQKPNFRLFCNAMSNRFLRLPAEERLHDATTSSVELAITFLRPWFHHTATDNLENAITKLCALSFSIAQWPCQWWTLDHPEIWDLVSSMVGALAEELREEQKSGEVTRLREVVDELEHALKTYEDNLRHAQSEAIKYRSIAVSFKDSVREEYFPPMPGPAGRAPIMSPMPSHMLTPHSSPELEALDEAALIPLPESPSLSEESLSLKSLSPLLSTLPSVLTELCASVPSSPHIKAPLPTLLEGDSVLSSSGPVSPQPAVCKASDPIRPDNDDAAEDVFAKHHAKQTWLESSISSSMLSESGDSLSAIDQHGTPSTSQTSIDPSTELNDIKLVDDDDWIILDDEEMDEVDEIVSRLPVFLETASYLATGFLVGAFITLCLFSSHRRTILTNLT
ncbi:hypothetical protein AX17_001630 [Amanita inopinata Kibby_2008]|nr:hypothetical protein AX17_001630 [Amanita inopinata Kibby_2008]